MKITGQSQHTKETNQEAFIKGGDFLGAGEFTVKVKVDDGKTLFHNQNDCDDEDK